jgi:hypothetical protein
MVLNSIFHSFWPYKGLEGADFRKNMELGNKATSTLSEFEFETQVEAYTVF